MVNLSSLAYSKSTMVIAEMDSGHSPEGAPDESQSEPRNQMTLRGKTEYRLSAVPALGVRSTMSLAAVTHPITSGTQPIAGFSRMSSKWMTIWVEGAQGKVPLLAWVFDA